MKEKFSTKHGKLVPEQAHILGYLLLIFAPFILLQSIWAGLVCSMISVFICFSTDGASFIPRRKLIKHYTCIFWIKFGKWQSYDHYSHMALLTQQVVSTSHSRSNRTTHTKELKHELYLLTESHRGKLLAFVFKNSDEAQKADPKAIANMLGVELTTYNPQISPQTLAKRR